MPPDGGGPKVPHEWPIYTFVSRTSICRAFLPLFFPWVLACAALAQTSDDAAPDLLLHSSVTEVRVNFSTTDENNHVIVTLQPSDFAVVDRDMVIRDFRSFVRSEYTRLDVAVLVDASESISPRFHQELATVVQLISQTETVPDEGFSVISFRNTSPAVVCAGNCRATLNGAQLPKIQNGGMTPLYDSVQFASRKLGVDNDPHARRILVLFSDGADTISLTPFTEALNSAVENDVAIYSVDVSRQPHNSPGTVILRSLALNTGGRYFTIEAGAGKLIEAILEDVHATYTVAYKLPSHATGFHEVRILPTHNPSLQFHCRRGYYYPSDQEN